MTEPQVNCFIGYATYMNVLMQCYAYTLCLHRLPFWRKLARTCTKMPGDLQNSQNTLVVSTLSTIRSLYWAPVVEHIPLGLEKTTSAPSSNDQWTSQNAGRHQNQQHKHVKAYSRACIVRQCEGQQSLPCRASVTT